MFHSPGYRSRYAEVLKIDFLRLPLTGNLELFRALARLGGELVALHLLESPIFESVAADVSPLKHPTRAAKTSGASESQSRLTSAATIPKVEFTGDKNPIVEKVSFVVGRVPSRGDSENPKTPAGGSGPSAPEKVRGRSGGSPLPCGEEPCGIEP